MYDIERNDEQRDGAEAPRNGGDRIRQRRIRLTLFWRTFFLLSALLLATTLAWLLSLRQLEFQPRTLHTAQQLATMVNLSRVGLTHSDPIARTSILKALSEQEEMRILPREPSDSYELFNKSQLGIKLTNELRARLGPDTLVASSVNGIPGLWVSFTLGHDHTWLLMDNSRLSPVGRETVALWLLVVVVISLFGAALMSRLLNKPIQELAMASYRLHGGDFASSQLDEEVATSEIRQLNIGFNRMAEQLSNVEQDRAVMLAGISHDLRTPLARLRLETEMSVSDTVAREHMVADIVQLDAIIDKFMDYARPVSPKRTGVNLNSLISNCMYSVQELGEMNISLDVPDNLFAYADEIELARVVTNLLENARRYGKTPGTNVTNVDVVATPFSGEKYIMLKIRDYGAGAPEEDLNNLLKPFFRGDAARTSAAGAGLGLSIVDKTIHRMGGRFALTNAKGGGLVAHIRLDRAPSNENWSEAQRLQRPKVKRNLVAQTGF